METLYRLSRTYFEARVWAKRVVDSPFVRLFALALLALVAWRLMGLEPAAPAATVSAPQTTAAAVVSATPPEAPGPNPAPSAAPTPPAAMPSAPASGPFNPDLVAWWVVSAAAPGAAGKVEALEHLHRAGKGFVGLDLSCRRMQGLARADATCTNGAFLKGVDLGPVDGRAARLEKADLSGADLEGARLVKAMLKSAVLSRATLVKADLAQADLSGADLRGARLASASLIGVGAQDAKFDGAEADGVKATDADLVRARLVGADLAGADLSGANLSGADLTGARLAGATLAGARFNLTTFTATEVSGADFADVKDLETVFATDVWAWADKPPKNLDPSVAETFQVALCAPGDDDMARRGYENAVKTGQIARGKPPGC